MKRPTRRARLAGLAVLTASLLAGAAVVVVVAGPLDSPPVARVAGPVAVESTLEPAEAAALRAAAQHEVRRPRRPADQSVARTVTLRERPEPTPTRTPTPTPTPTPTETTPAPAHSPTPGETAQAAPEPRPAQPGVAPATFTISSFNVLGSSHTSGRMAPGPVRIRQAATLLNIHGVDIAGLQEMQSDQFRSFQASAGGTFAAFPGLSAGPLGVENSVVWRRSRWTLESARTVQIPYFDGRLRPMPYVLLRHLGTGRKVWVANFHNPASNPKRGNNDRHRARAAAIETSLAARLWSQTGYPVFVLGDMNDREAYFCQITSGAPMQAANGGSNDGGCRPPPYPMPVDWIFGSEVVTFSGYVRDEGALVRRTSDHPMVRADVTLDGRDGLG